MTARMTMRLNTRTERTSRETGRTNQATRAAVRPGASEERSAHDRHHSNPVRRTDRSRARHAPRKPDSERPERICTGRSNRRTGTGWRRASECAGRTGANSRRKSASILAATRSVTEFVRSGMAMPSKARMDGAGISRHQSAFFLPDFAGSRHERYTGYIGLRRRCFGLMRSARTVVSKSRWKSQLQIHSVRAWNTQSTPLGNVLRRAIKQRRDICVATDPV